MMDFPRKDNVRLENNKTPFKFQVLDWYIPEDDKSQKCINAENRKKGIPVEYPDEPSVYDIIMFGSTEEGHTVSVKVSDFEPYFYVKIPDKFACKQPLTGWVNDFYEYLIDTKYHDKKYGYERDIISKRYKDHLVSIKLVKKKEFYGFTNNRDFYFMKITVKSLGLFNSLRYFFKSPPEEFQKKYAYQKFEMYESGLTPFLRFIHLQNIKPCGWIELPARSYTIISNSCDDDSYSKANFHLETNYKYVKPYDSNRTAPILIASFDIECTSSHGDFPVAIKDYSKVVNDLYTIAKSGNFSKQTIIEGLLTAYSEDVSIGTETLHRIYSKSEPTEKQITKIIDKIISSMNDICNSSNRDSETYNKGVLLQLLNKNMPKLTGDSIIQIGTTVHRYGSPDIIYKSMISLKSCDDIDEVDVVCCKTEEELLLRWKDLIQRLSPDVLIGYNIFGFDFPYVWNRSKELGIDDYGVGFGRLSERNCQMLEQKLSSSALGDNIMYYIDADGIILIDVLKIMQKDHKLDSYKLDNVAKVFIGDKKNDLTPNEIFSKFRGNSYDRKVIAEYCIQDCCLVNHLFHKLKILENNIGMGNVCSVPLNYLFMRGQGIKIFSLVANECRKSNYLIPDLKGFREEDDDESGYEGAIVLIPNEGMYLDDYIVTLDFASLYPSSMIERNLSHDCYVNNPEYDNLPGIEYKTVEYDIYEGKGDAKHVVGKKSCKFVQLPNNEKGIIPRILQYLLKQRKVTRKKIEYTTLYTDNTTYSGILKSETDDKYKLYDIENDKYIDVLKSDVIKTEDTYDPFEKDVLDALQLAYKITANSLYGQIGARTSQIYLKEIAACTTATGRERILHAKEFVETEYGAEVIYGDSVTSYTPITLRVKGNILVDKIEDISSKYGNNNWIPCIEKGKQDKESCEIPDYVEVWSDKGWTPIKRVIRHELIEHKKIIRVLTHTGVVDVTDDHSLLLLNGDTISPKDIDIGTKLLHKDIPTSEFPQNNTSVSVDEARILGFFMGDGSCGTYNTSYGLKSTWALNNKDLGLLENYKNLCKKIYIDYNWTIINTLDSSGVYKLVPSIKNNNLIKNFVNDYRDLLYVDKNKIIPYKILNSSYEIRKSFWDGLYDADGDKNGHRIDQKNMISAHMIYLLGKSLGYNVSINTRSDKKDIFRITVTNNSQRYCKDAVKKVSEISYDGYVYDLTTSNHHFQAGVGDMIVHNTDSIFCKFKKVDENGNILKELEGLKFAIEQGKKASEDINKVLPYPQNLEYEKTFYPFIIFSKKRYVGNLYEEDPYKKPKQKSMGIVLKRRDNAPIVKKIYGGIIDILLNEKNLNKSVEFLDRELKRLINNEYPLEDLIISKTLKSTYVNPQSMAHKVLADRMALRDPGNKPQVNDRIPFVYVKVPPEKEIKLQGDRVEHPDYIRENNLVPDYEFYITNQLLRPVAQLYTLCLEQLPNYDRDVNYWIDKAQELQEKKEIYKDENKLANYIQTLKERDVERLLFSNYITKKVKKVSESSTKKITAIQKFNLDSNSLLLQFNIAEKKENKSKIFESISICNNKEYVKTISCKSSTTKCNACTDLLNSILRDVIDDNKEKIETDGIRIEIKFSLYKNKLIKMLDEYETFYEKFHKAQQSLDIGLVKEFQEMERTLIIPALLNSRKARYMII